MKLSLRLVIEPRSFKTLVWLIIIVLGYYFAN